MPEKNLDFDRIIDRRNTKSVKYDLAAKKGMPEDVLPLWVADMDFRVSSYIQEAIARQVEHGVFGYSDTGEEYFEAVKGWMKRHHGWDVEADWLGENPRGCICFVFGSKSLYGTGGQRFDTTAGLLSFQACGRDEWEKNYQQYAGI